MIKKRKRKKKKVKVKVKEKINQNHLIRIHKVIKAINLIRIHKVKYNRNQITIYKSIIFQKIIFQTIKVTINQAIQIRIKYMGVIATTAADIIVINHNGVEIILIKIRVIIKTKIDNILIKIIDQIKEIIKKTISSFINQIIITQEEDIPIITTIEEIMKKEKDNGNIIIKEIISMTTFIRIKIFRKS